MLKPLKRLCRVTITLDHEARKVAEFGTGVGRNLLRLFEAQAQVVPLVCRDIDISGKGDANERNQTRNNARLALRVTAAVY